MGEPSTSCRISAATNTRLRNVLAQSKLSRDQFVDFLITEALDQIDEPEVSYEPLRIVLTVRRELGKSAGETVHSRLSSIRNVLAVKAEPRAPYSPSETSSPRLNEEPEALLHELVSKLQENPKMVSALASLLDISRP